MKNMKKKYRNMCIFVVNGVFLFINLFVIIYFFDIIYIYLVNLNNIILSVVINDLIDVLCIFSCLNCLVNKIFQEDGYLVLNLK